MEKKLWAYVGKNPETYYLHKNKEGFPSTQKTKHLFYEKSTPTEYKEEFIAFLYTWKIFIEFCNEKNIKVIFSTWDLQDSINLKNANIFNNYLHIEKQKVLSFVSNYYRTNEISPIDKLKRDGHHGLIAHTFWAECFYQAYINE